LEDWGDWDEGDDWDDGKGEEPHSGDILVEYDHTAKPSAVAFLKWLIGCTGWKFTNFKRRSPNSKIEIPKFCNNGVTF